MPTMNDPFWWIALIRARGIALSDAHALLERFGDPRAVFERAGKEAPRAKLAEPDREEIEPDLEWLARPGHHLITWGDDLYPPLLAGIADPPLALFVAGDPGSLSTPALAIVGSRNPTAAGTENAEAFAEHLAAHGFTIVSGLALGIDAAAHRGALRSGRTVAVCGTGLDEVYPPKNRGLAGKIAASGAVVSEFPSGTPARPENFPRRNRIISGLAVGTLVVEAAMRSGSLITARLAIEQGREVFAIPGSIHNPLAKGCHRLIRDGAKLVDDASHIVEELGALLGDAGASPSRRESKVATDDGIELDQDYENLLKCLEETPLTMDKLIERSGLTPAAVSSMLLIMELRGLVESAPGGRYSRRRKGT